MNQTQSIKRPKTNILLLVAALASGYIGGALSQKSVSVQNVSTETRQQIVSSEAEVIADVAKNISESVVSIDVTTKQTGQDFFGFTRQFEAQGAGTGVIISSEGVIVTNKHVVATSVSELQVTLSDGTVLEAEVIARDPRNDIAFLKVKDKKDKNLKPAPLGDSSKLKVGDKVLAVGNALGEFQNTVTSGIISGYGRDISAGDGASAESLTNLLQTDAAINRGNSGGPLVNLSGEVIGINTAITGSDNGQSLGFAIPVNDIKAQITSVLEKGKIERPYLGVRYQTITERFAYVYNLPSQKGAYLPPTEPGESESILPDSPAEKAGLKEKDIITKIGDKEITETTSLAALLGDYKVGETVRLTILRDNKEQVISAVLEAAPSE